jgi:hypothetical protein
MPFIMYAGQLCIDGFLGLQKNSVLQDPETRIRPGDDRMLGVTQGGLSDTPSQPRMEKIKENRSAKAPSVSLKQPVSAVRERLELAQCRRKLSHIASTVLFAEQSRNPSNSVSS